MQFRKVMLLLERSCKLFGKILMRGNRAVGERDAAAGLLEPDLGNGQEVV